MFKMGNKHFTINLDSKDLKHPLGQCQCQNLVRIPWVDSRDLH